MKTTKENQFRYNKPEERYKSINTIFFIGMTFLYLIEDLKIEASSITLQIFASFSDLLLFMILASFSLGSSISNLFPYYIKSNFFVCTLTNSINT